MAAHPWFLQTERLGFRTWTERDFELAWGLWGDERVTRFVGGPFTAERVRERLAREIATQAEVGFQYWPIFRVADGAHVGCCGLRPHGSDASVPAFGFYVRSEHWGNGFAPEASRAVIRHAFGPLARAALFAGHHPDNGASAHLLGKLGFRYTHHELYSPTGLMHPSYLLTRPAGA